MQTQVDLVEEASKYNTWLNSFLSLIIHRVWIKTAKLFLSELRQISTNFDNFCQNDGKNAEIMRGALIFHLI